MALTNLLGPSARSQDVVALSALARQAGADAAVQRLVHDSRLQEGGTRHGDPREPHNDTGR